MTLDEALGCGVRDDAGQQANGTDRVVVARDRVLNVVGVAVGVEDCDNGDTKLVRLVNGEVLLLGVNDPHSGRGLREVTNTTEALLQLHQFAALDEQLLLGVATGGVGEVDLFEFLHARKTLGNRLEVGEESTQPTLVDVGLADALSLLGDGALSLLLGSDEEDGAAVGNRLLDVVIGLVDVCKRLLQVDDVAARALGQNKALHFRVPTAGLVPEVNAAVKQLADGNDSHGRNPYLARAALRQRRSVPTQLSSRPVGAILVPGTHPTRTCLPPPRDFSRASCSKCGTEWMRLSDLQLKPKFTAGTRSHAEYTACFENHSTAPPLRRCTGADSLSGHVGTRWLGVFGTMGGCSGAWFSPSSPPSS